MLEVQHLIVSLAEPSPMQAHVIRKALGEMGISRIETHSNGQELIQHARQHRPDLVVSAYYLPDMTGNELVHTMRDSADLSSMPFILISSESKTDRLEPIRQAGSLAMLPKPFSMAQLDAALGDVLDFINAENLGAEVDADLATLQILIIDDSLTSRHHIRAVLEKLGFEHFTEAATTDEAQQLLANGSFHLIILDYHMPKMNGCELAQTMLINHWQEQVPILMISSETSSEFHAQAEAAGVAACCEKPFSTNQLRTIIKDLLREY